MGEPIDRKKAVETIKRIRLDFECVVARPLVEVEASVGLLLRDVAAGLGLDQEEQRRALGKSLLRDLSEAI